MKSLKINSGTPNKQKNVALLNGSEPYFIPQVRLRKTGAFTFLLQRKPNEYRFGTRGWQLDLGKQDIPLLWSW